MAIAFALAPVIASVDKKGVFASLKLSSKLAFGNARVIVPAMMLWLAAKLLVLFLVSHLSVLTPNVASVVLTALSNPGVCPAADLPVPPVHAAARLTPTQQKPKGHASARPFLLPHRGGFRLLLTLNQLQRQIQVRHQNQLFVAP